MDLKIDPLFSLLGGSTGPAYSQKIASAACMCVDDIASWFCRKQPNLFCGFWLVFQDMEKWAKTLNAQKDAMKEVFKKNFQPIGQNMEKESAAADAGFAVLEKKVGEM